MIETCDERTLPDLRARLARGEIFLHHPGSVFGLGADAFFVPAIDKLRRLKGSADGKGFIVLIPDAGALTDLGVPPDSRRDRLLSQYWPGGLTVVLPSDDPRLTHLRVDGKVAFRVPAAINFRGFLARTGGIIASTSVNRSGEPPVNDLRVIRKHFPGWMDFELLFRQEYIEAPAPSTVIGFDESDPILIREGAIPFTEIANAWARPLIVFICTGNICRSPIAEYRMRYLVETTGLPHRVCSAGMLPGGVAISENSRIVLEEWGLDGSGHRSDQFGPELLRAAWRVLTMTSLHRADILDWYPNAAGKVYTINEFVGLEGDIADPFGQDLETYRKTGAMIDDACKRILQRLEMDV
jgi:protein arginine phosphatase